MHLWIQYTSIRASRPQRSVDSSAGLIAVFHALHRLLAPRHPPHALSSLAALIPSSAHKELWVVEAGIAFQVTMTHKPLAWWVESNDPILSLSGSCRDRKKQRRDPLTLLTSSLLVNCNFYRCQIVKELLASAPVGPSLPSWFCQEGFLFFTPSIQSDKGHEKKFSSRSNSSIKIFVE